MCLDSGSEVACVMSANDHTIPTTCQIHGCWGFCNLRVSKVGGEIVPNPHVDGSCVMRSDHAAATQLFDIRRGAVGVNWYRRSLIDHDTHRGHLRRGRVLAECGVKFSPLRAWRGKVAWFCQVSRLILSRFVWSVTGLAWQANRPHFPALRVNRRQDSDAP